jgi:hypothetical protein
MVNEASLYGRGAAFEVVSKGRASCLVVDDDGWQSLVCGWTARRTPLFRRSERKKNHQGGVTTESPTKQPLVGQRRGRHLSLSQPQRETIPSSRGQT